MRFTKWLLVLFITLTSFVFLPLQAEEPNSDGGLVSVVDEDLSKVNMALPPYCIVEVLQLDKIWDLTYEADEPNVKFEVQYATKKTGPFKKAVLHGYYSDTSYSGICADVPCTPGKYVYVRSRIYTQVGSVKTYADWRVVSFYGLIGDVKNLVVDYHGENSVKIKWSKTRGADRYEVVLWQDYEQYDGNETIVATWKGKYQSSLTLKSSKLDPNKPFIVLVRATKYKDAKRGEGDGFVENIATNTLKSAVKNVTVTPNAAGTEVTFSFTTELDFIDYDLARDPNWNSGVLASFDTALDFNLFVATSAQGPWKRVITTADFSDNGNLKLTYKAKYSKKLYYKILPTWERRPEYVSSACYAYNSANEAIVVSHTLRPGQPQNIQGTIVSSKRVTIKVDKGVAIKGYELYDATTNKLIKRQTSNVFTIAATAGKERVYKIRCFRMNGKKRVYSDFSETIALLPF